MLILGKTKIPLNESRMEYSLIFSHDSQCMQLRSRNDLKITGFNIFVFNLFFKLKFKIKLKIKQSRVNYRPKRWYLLIYSMFTFPVVDEKPSDLYSLCEGHCPPTGTWARLSLRTGEPEVTPSSGETVHCILRTVALLCAIWDVPGGLTGRLLQRHVTAWGHCGDIIHTLATCMSASAPRYGLGILWGHYGNIIHTLLTFTLLQRHVAAWGHCGDIIHTLATCMSASAPRYGLGILWGHYGNIIHTLLTFTLLQRHVAAWGHCGDIIHTLLTIKFSFRATLRSKDIVGTSFTHL